MNVADLAQRVRVDMLDGEITGTEEGLSNVDLLTHEGERLRDAHDLIHGACLEYLSAGGLFNPESMEHDKVRDMVVRIRDLAVNCMK